MSYIEKYVFIHQIIEIQWTAIKNLSEMMQEISRITFM